MVGGERVMECIISYEVVRKGISPKMTFDQRLGETEGGSHVDIWGWRAT